MTLFTRISLIASNTDPRDTMSASCWDLIPANERLLWNNDFLDESFKIQAAPLLSLFPDQTGPTLHLTESGGGLVHLCEAFSSNTISGPLWGIKKCNRNHTEASSLAPVRVLTGEFLLFVQSRTNFCFPKCAIASKGKQGESEDLRTSSCCKARDNAYSKRKGLEKIFRKKW